MLHFLQKVVDFAVERPPVVFETPGQDRNLALRSVQGAFIAVEKGGNFRHLLACGHLSVGGVRAAVGPVISIEKPGQGVRLRPHFSPLCFPANQRLTDFSQLSQTLGCGRLRRNQFLGLAKERVDSERWYSQGLRQPLLLISEMGRY